MDDQMIGRLLQTYGVQQPNARQANAAREFFASNPDIAERRAMGVRGAGLDDNSDVFGAMLDKLIQQSDATAPAGTVEVGQPQMDTTKAATVPNAPRKKMEPSRQGEYGPGPSPSRQGEYSPPVTRESVRGGPGFGVDDVLTALLGLTSAGALAPKAAPTSTMPAKAQPRAVGNDGAPIPEKGRWDTRRGVSDVVDLNARNLPPPNKQITGPNKQLTGPQDAPTSSNPRQLTDEISDLSRVPTNEPAPTTVTGDPNLTAQAKKAQYQAEIDAENEAAARKLQDQIMQRNNEMNTRKLLQQSKKVVTGR